MVEAQLSSSVRGLLETLVAPSPLTLDEDGAGRIEVADVARVKDGTQVFEALASNFAGMQRLDQKALLDALYLVLRRSVFDVARFRSLEKIVGAELSAVTLLLNLLDEHIDDPLIAKRLIRLLGVMSQVAITVQELHRFLEHLKTPGPLSLSLLQAFKMMLRQEEASSKHFHASFFSLMGAGAGLYSNTSSVFFNKELQVSMWFRLETFPSEEEPSPHLLWCSNEDGQCLDVLVQGKSLCVFVDINGIPTLQRIETWQPRTSNLAVL